MTQQKKIDMLRRMMEGDDTDEGILKVYLEIAANQILNRMYPYKEDYEGIEVPDRYAMIQLKVANYLLNKRGAEGEIQHIENGVHRNYGNADVPDAMLKDIVPFAQAIR